MPNYLPPSGYFSWKGQTFNQITTTIQKNTATISGQNGTTTTGLRNYFKSRPLKIYRREIATNTPSRCNYRTSVRIDEMNAPNGYMISKSYNDTGLVNTLDINLTENTYMRGASSCNTAANCMSQSANALRRVRSSGMIKRKYNAITNDATYFTNTNQYLDNRRKTYQKNQFTFVDPDTGCRPTYKPSNDQFSTQGAVSSSSLVSRIKYDTVNTIASQTGTVFGNNTANALAYSTYSGNYTIKDKLGFPRKCTPKVTPAGEFKTCTDKRLL
jgi:hypothetical protein